MRIKFIEQHTFGNKLAKVTKEGRAFTARLHTLQTVGGVAFVLSEFGDPSATFSTRDGALFGLAAEASKRGWHDVSASIRALLP